MLDNIREWIKLHSDEFEESVGRDEIRPEAMEKEEKGGEEEGGVITAVEEGLEMVGGYGKGVLGDLGMTGASQDSEMGMRVSVLVVLLMLGLLYELFTGPGL
jgi:hypothetical protein